MSKRKILLVDDEEHFTRLMKLNLEKSGPYEVREVNKGLEGFAAAKEYRPDLILLDIIMPDIAGGDLAAQIRADKEIGGTPILFLTAIVSKTDTEGGSETLGGYPVIPKPVNVDAVISAIEKNIGNKTGA